MKKSLQKFIHYTLIFSLAFVTTVVLAQAPTFTSVPTAGASGVNQSANIVLSFNVNLKGISNVTLDNTNIDAKVILRLTDVAGADIPFDATIASAQNITINPTSDLPSGAVIYVSIGGVEGDASQDDIDPDPTSFTFTVADYAPPVITFNPAGGASGVSTSGNLIISFNEAVRKTDNSAIDATALLTLVELKLTNDAGGAHVFTASINGGNDVITIDPTADLTPNTTYYLEINPVEDVSNNATTASNITFTTSDNTAPIITFNPVGGAVGVSETGDIFITFDEAVRNINNSAITPTDILSLFELKLTNDAGAAVPFTGSIDVANLVITIDPTPTLASSTLYYIEINPVEDIGNNATIATNATFTTGDTQPPLLTINPLGGAVNVPLASNLTITFNEAVRQIDDSPIDATALLALVELKLTNDAGGTVPFTASINGGNTIITIDPTSNLTSNTVYYLEINPVEDFAGNAITATNITFTTIDVNPPVATFNPVNLATGVVETNDIIITFDEPIRDIDDSPITVGELLALVELKLTNNAGAPVPFTATITGGNTIITIDPTSVLAGNTVYYVEINPVEDASNNAILATNITFTTGDTQAPIITFNPLDNATNFSALGNVVITFNEPIRKLDDTPITPADIQGGLIEFKLTNDAGGAVPFTATINGLNTIITLNPNSTLLHNQVYYIEVNPVEDGVNNATIAQNIDFTTEDRPSITTFSPAAAETCIGDPVTINGARFTGTGSPPSGNTKPIVLVNGVAVPAANVTSFNSTQIIFTLPSMTPGTYPITVRNVDSDLLSAGVNFDVLPAINQAVTVTPATLNPAQNSNVNVDLTTTQTASYSYSLILTAAPGGYSVVPPATVHGPVAGNSGTLVLNTAEGADPDLTLIGNYSYRIDVARTNCVTKTLTTVFSLTVASLAVNVSTTGGVTNEVCNGSSITLIGAASGGTGFYQFIWTSTPPGFSSSSSSPTVSPTSNIQYNLELRDNVGNTVFGNVAVTVNPLPVADIVPNAGESAVRTNYVLENRDYLITGSPAGVGGVFTGQGVTLKSDGFYYFNPFNAGVNTGGWPIVYTYTNPQGCVDTDTENFKVNTAAINNLDLSYCRNSAPGVPLTQEINLSPNSTFPASIQFTRLVFYASMRNSPYTTCIAENVPNSFTYCNTTNPLVITSSALVADIQAGVSLPIGTLFSQPTSYSLNLNTIRSIYGYSTNYYFYILAYGKDASGYEDFYTFQYFDVYDNNPAPSITGINQNENVCADAASPITLTSSEPGYTVTNFSIVPVPADFSGALSGTNNANFNPGYSGFTSPTSLDERPLTIRMDYADFNNCPNRVTRNFNWVKKPNVPIANDTAFCQFGNPSTFKLKARKSGSADNTFWYDNTMVELASGTFIFDVPGINGTIPTTEDFNVSQSYKGCESDPLEVTFSINPAPNAVFTRSPICEDKDFLLTGPEQSPGVPYPKYVWTYGDGLSDIVLANNTTTHNYGPGSALIPRTIGLTVTTSLGCINTSTDAITVGPNPVPDFNYNFVCENDQTKFFGSTNIPVTHYEWNFDDLTLIPKTLAGNAAPEGGTIQEPVHNFLGGVGEYDVTVTAYTASQCFNSKTKKVNILEYLTHDSATPYDMASINGGDGFWTKQDIAGNSSWEFAIPTSPIMNEFTSKTWVTNAAGNYSPGEYSFLNSPCLNIANIDRPVLSFNYILNTEFTKDGVAFEYSKDGGVTWFQLGGQNSGFNWYNSSLTIGNSLAGLSGNSWDLLDNIQKDTIVQARRALDNLPNLSAAERAKVRFRIVFKTNLDTEQDGIAFNNLTIASRNRVLLVENFTNEGDPSYDANNTSFKNILVTEAVKIQYHVGAPGSDTNYLINTADPSARAAFYGIPLTDQAIPRGYIDGYSNGNFTAAGWVTTQFSQRALKVSPFSIVVGTVPSSDPTYITVSATITSLEAISRFRKPILQIALVEKTAGTNEYVLRKLMPSAVGKKLATPMAQGTIVNIVESVRIENPDIVISQLAIVAFIQDEETKEVYQAAIDMSPTNLPTVNITGTEDPEYAEKINFFPNPANHELNIQLPVAVTKNTPVRMIDTYGRTVFENSFAPGDRAKTINTSDLIDGVYIMQINTPEGNAARRKIMVIHR